MAGRYERFSIGARTLQVDGGAARALGGSGGWTLLRLFNVNPHSPRDGRTAHFLECWTADLSCLGCLHPPRGRRGGGCSRVARWPVDIMEIKSEPAPSNKTLGKIISWRVRPLMLSFGIFPPSKRTEGWRVLLENLVDGRYERLVMSARTLQEDSREAYFLKDATTAWACL